MGLADHVQEAIETLGYVDPKFAPQIIKSLEDAPGINPKAVSREFRKQGTQLEPDEKRRIGLRANTLFSQNAFDSLTEKGKQKPIKALENTFLRAMLSEMREQQIASMEKMATEHGFGDNLKAQILGGIEGCPGCNKLSGDLVSPTKARELIPPKECIREACAMTVRENVDWIAVELEKEDDNQAPKGFLARIFGR